VAAAADLVLAAPSDVVALLEALADALVQVG
jgi:hypothetical protein